MSRGQSRRGEESDQITFFFFMSQNVRRARGRAARARRVHRQPTHAAIRSCDRPRPLHTVRTLCTLTSHTRETICRPTRISRTRYSSTSVRIAHLRPEGAPPTDCSCAGTPRRLRGGSTRHHHYSITTTRRTSTMPPITTNSTITLTG